MCGIFAYISNEPLTDEQVEHLITCANKIKHRGPDKTKVVRITDKVLFVFHRLCINDLTELGDQPLTLDNRYHLMCNGEIYNHLELEEKYGFTTMSHSDCEVILHLYKKGGINLVTEEIKGYYAFTIWDNDEQRLYVGRDVCGVRQLYFGHDEHGLCFCSEMKGIPQEMTIEAFPTYYIAYFSNFDTSQFIHRPIHYLQEPLLAKDTTIEEQRRKVKDSMITAVQRRFMTERPYGALLSGGLDSSIVAALAARLNPEKRIHTFTIGLENSPDVLAARIVAKHINSIHHEIITTKEKMIARIPFAIKQNETWDTTTIRASVPMLELLEWIRDNTDIVVIFSGEGADEAGAGYRYFHYAPSDDDLGKECLTRLDELSYFDCLRCDKSIAAFGIEVRAPHLDDDFLKTYMRVPYCWKRPIKNGGPEMSKEKWLIRQAFDDGLLPSEILWRSKEAFSDGVSTNEESWYTIIQNHVDTIISNEEFEREAPKYEPKPLLKESYWYRKLFEEFYPGKGDIIPHYWMPKWTDTKDPSARTI